VLDVRDVLLALSLDHTRIAPRPIETRVPPRHVDLPAYQALHDGPATIGDVAERAGLALLDAAMSLARLEQSGWLHQVDGWYERAGAAP
jgi:predicted Rossmann fold nucleotide-binding protein DprA/Smf involved in DNA uptake